MKSHFAFQVHRIFVLILSALCYAFVFFHRSAPAVLSSYLADAYNVDVTLLSQFSSIFFWPYAILQIFAGILADIMDPAYLLCFSSILSALGSIVCGISKSLQLSLIARFFVGIGCAPCYVPISRLMANWFDPKYYAIVTGCVLGVGGAGGIISQEPLRLFAEKFGWRWSFYGISILSFIIAILILFIVRNEPTKFGYDPPYEKPEPKELTVKERFVQLWGNIKVVLKKKYIYLGSFFCLIQNGTYFNVTSFWGGPYFESVFPSENKGTLLTSLSVGMIVGSLFLPPLSNLINSRKYAAVMCSEIGSLCCLVFVLCDVQLGFWGMYFIVIIWGSVTGGASVLIFAMLKELYPIEVSATAVGFANCFPHFGAAILQEIATGILKNYGKTGRYYSRNAFRNAIWIVSLVCNALSVIGPLLCPNQMLSKIGQESSESDYSKEYSSDQKSSSTNSEIDSTYSEQKEDKEGQDLTQKFNHLNRKSEDKKNNLEEEKSNEFIQDQSFSNSVSIQRSENESN